MVSEIAVVPIEDRIQELTGLLPESEDGQQQVRHSNMLDTFDLLCFAIKAEGGLLIKDEPRFRSELLRIFYGYSEEAFCNVFLRYRLPWVQEPHSFRSATVSFSRDDFHKSGKIIHDLLGFDDQHNLMIVPPRYNGRAAETSFLYQASNAFNIFVMTAFPNIRMQAVASTPETYGLYSDDILNGNLVTYGPADCNIARAHILNSELQRASEGQLGIEGLLTVEQSMPIVEWFKSEQNRAKAADIPRYVVLLDGQRQSVFDLYGGAFLTPDNFSSEAASEPVLGVFARNVIDGKVYCSFEGTSQNGTAAAILAYCQPDIIYCTRQAHQGDNRSAVVEYRENKLSVAQF